MLKEKCKGPKEEIARKKLDQDDVEESKRKATKLVDRECFDSYDWPKKNSPDRMKANELF